MLLRLRLSVLYRQRCCFSYRLKMGSMQSHGLQTRYVKKIKGAAYIRKTATLVECVNRFLLFQVRLQNYIQKQNLRMIDFFNQFDKDGSMSVTREEFAQGLEVFLYHTNSYPFFFISVPWGEINDWSALKLPVKRVIPFFFR